MESDFFSRANFFKSVVIYEGGEKFYKSGLLGGCTASQRVFRVCNV